jgi:hypothetical protein
VRFVWVEGFTVLYVSWNYSSRGSPMWSGICVGLKTLRREASGFKRVRLKRSDPLETSSLSMMKKVVSLLVSRQNLIGL